MSEEQTSPTMEDVVGYLLGSGDLEGLWWGEADPERPRFWWRRRLLHAWQAHTRAETPQSIPGEREAIVAYMRAEADSHNLRGLLIRSEALIDAIARGEHLSTRQAPIEGSVKEGGASASRQPAGQASPSAPVSAGSSPSGDHQAQGRGL